MIAVLIFAFGLLALAQLQGALTQSSGYTKSKATATSLAEEKLECMRSFSQIGADADGYCDSQNPGLNVSYGEITDGSDNYGGTAISGTNFTTEWEVVEMWYDNATDTFVDEDPAGAGAGTPSRYKQVTVRTGWGDVLDGVATTTFNDGEDRAFVELVDIVPSIPPGASGRVLAGPSDGVGPTVAYTPGLNPDVVAISLGGSRFKETLLPEPDVTRTRDDEFVVTAFDVVTFSQTEGSASFLRREEFRVLNCECTLTSGQGRRPTVFNGNQYVEGEFANKTTGISANNDQDFLCNTCCRDHHDGGTAVDGQEGIAEGPDAFTPEASRLQYDPFKPSAEFSSGNHKHYGLDNQGDLVLAAQGDDYLESCRLIRKDGFFRVAQDVNAQVLSNVPEDYLDEDGETGPYSNYITGYTEEFINGIGGSYPQTLPNDNGFAATNPSPTSTVLPLNVGTTCDDDVAGPDDQCLRSRVLYIDYVTDETKTLYNCLLSAEDADGNVSPEDRQDCGAFTAFGKLEVLPFFELNVTNLSLWSETPTDNPVDVLSEPIEDDGQYVRGLATLTGSGGSDALTGIAESNPGLTSTRFIAPRDTDDDFDLQDTLAINGGAGVQPPAPDVDGSVDTVNQTRVDPNSITITENGSTVCNYPVVDPNDNQAPPKYECSVETDGISFTVGNYVGEKNNGTIVNNEVCLDLGGVPLLVTVNTSVTGEGTLAETTQVDISGIGSLTGLLTIDIDIVNQGDC